ncbi:restriction endonuclease [Lampropedia aestuarii]|uniref:restriction endonuclease n=1 Tax=Lampropedia aestuarii TaxID=2562762 RepID=UPI0024692192|nr:restriction endonuclease [Lampropedia aestuarii]MDH5858926.1 restriction endonuclease [Lampropedia aestuarii]
MSIIEISRDEFDDLGIERMGFFPERGWFKSTELDLAGTVIRDPFDKDWSYVLVAKDEDEVYRYLEGEVSLPTQHDAESKLYASALRIEIAGVFQEKFYTEPDSEDEGSYALIVTSIDEEVKKYLKKHPQKLYELSPRKFEELVASILQDLGFEVELTQATRDGGRDIIAHVRNAVSSYLTYIECKRYAADNKVGVGIVREIIGVHHIRKPTKSIIVTTSFFSKDAIKEAEKMESQLDLKDFTDIKVWLQRY